jgi:hypothetical protein
VVEQIMRVLQNWVYARAMNQEDPQLAEAFLALPTTFEGKS